jgi:hypothetical protein
MCDEPKICYLEGVVIDGKTEACPFLYKTKKGKETTRF